MRMYYLCLGVVSILVSVLIFLSATALTLGDQGKFKNIAPEVQLFQEADFELARWPSVMEIKRKLVPQAEVPQRESVGTYNWIKREFQSKWLPADLKERLIPIRKLHEKDDYFIVRYEVDGWLIQIKDSKCLHITLRPLEPLGSTGDLSSYVVRIVQMFLKPSKRRQNLTKWRETMLTGNSLYEGVLLPKREHDSVPFSQLSWVSDGTAVYFALEKRGPVDPNEEPSGVPVEYVGSVENLQVTNLKGEMERALGHKKFPLQPGEMDIKKKYQELIQEKVQELGRNRLQGIAERISREAAVSQQNGEKQRELWSVPADALKESRGLTEDLLRMYVLAAFPDGVAREKLRGVLNSPWTSDNICRLWEIGTSVQGKQKHEILNLVLHIGHKYKGEVLNEIRPRLDDIFKELGKSDWHPSLLSLSAFMGSVLGAPNDLDCLPESLADALEREDVGPTMLPVLAELGSPKILTLLENFQKSCSWEKEEHLRILDEAIIRARAKISGERTKGEEPEDERTQVTDDIEPVQSSNRVILALIIACIVFAGVTVFFLLRRKHKTT